MDLLRKLLGIDPTMDDFHGTWKTIINLPTIQGEGLSLYDNCGKFASVGKITKLPGLWISRLGIYSEGSYYIKSSMLYHRYENLKALYSVGVPQDYLNILMSSIINEGSLEIISFKKDELVTKEKSGMITSAKKIKIEIDPSDLESFAREDQ